MRRVRFQLARLLSVAAVAGCTSATAPPEVLLVEDFNAENSGTYELNFTEFTNWNVVAGTVDLIGTPPYDDFLPASQGLYVDLDGTTTAAGTLRSKTDFDLRPGKYRLEFKMAGTPRSNQPPNTVIVSVGSHLQETITLPSHAPLSTYVRTFRVDRRTSAHLEFAHEGGDDYGSMIDDVRFERL